MIYRVTTKTTLEIFTKTEFVVNRRFSDFLGLHRKLMMKYLSKGIILPSPPEKDSLSMAKVKIAQDGDGPINLIDRRRSFLERYLNRLVQRENLLADSDVREFIEAAHDLPKATDTKALSGAGVLRALTSISNQVTKLTVKSNEQDSWFDENHTFVSHLKQIFKSLNNQLNNLYEQHREVSYLFKHFSTYLNHLATTEEHPLLSSALIELANLQEKLEQNKNEYANKEYGTITELVREYVLFLDMIDLVLLERIQSHQYWLNAELTLNRKRETKHKLQETPKGKDKLPQIEMEIIEWEKQAATSKQNLEDMSKTVKEEFEMFEQVRCRDFQQAIGQHLRQLLEQQERILQIWEAFLPEANKIHV
jgi:sorting nexin-1/2